MRITDRIIQRTTLANLQLDVRKAFEAPLASTTGRRVRSASDDSIGASQVMQSDGSLRALEQYQQNVASGVHLGVCSAGMTASPRLGDASGTADLRQAVAVQLFAKVPSERGEGRRCYPKQGAA